MTAQVVSCFLGFSPQISEIGRFVNWSDPDYPWAKLIWDPECRNQYLTMAFAQLTYRESLRDIEACLGAAPTKLYHMGFLSAVS